MEIGQKFKSTVGQYVYIPATNDFEFFMSGNIVTVEGITRYDIYFKEHQGRERSVHVGQFKALFEEVD